MEHVISFRLQIAKILFKVTRKQKNDEDEYIFHLCINIEGIPLNLSLVTKINTNLIHLILRLYNQVVSIHNCGGD